MNPDDDLAAEEEKLLGLGQTLANFGRIPSLLARIAKSTERTGNVFKELVGEEDEAGEGAALLPLSVLKQKREAERKRIAEEQEAKRQQQRAEDEAKRREETRQEVARRKDEKRQLRILELEAAKRLAHKQQVDADQREEERLRKEKEATLGEEARKAAKLRSEFHAIQSKMNPVPGAGIKHVAEASIDLEELDPPYYQYCKDSKKKCQASCCLCCCTGCCTGSARYKAMTFRGKQNCRFLMVNGIFLLCMFLSKCIRRCNLFLISNSHDRGLSGLQQSGRGQRWW